MSKATLGAVILLSGRLAAQATSELVTPLPAPTGPFPTATVFAHLTDSSRTSPGFARGRPITLQIWYPAARPGGSSMPYLVEPGLSAALLRYEYYGIDSMTIDRWSKLNTHSPADIPPAQGTYPLLVFSVGLGVIRANYTSLAEELASWGYAVALVESPLQGLMVLLDGRALLDATGRYGEPPAHRSGVADWAGDLSFALDRLTAQGASPGLAAIGRSINPAAIGALGHSSGGLVAIAGCESDRRVRACVNMDGGLVSPDQQPLADFVARGVTKPTLFLRSQRSTTTPRWRAAG